MAASFDEQFEAWLSDRLNTIKHRASSANCSHPTPPRLTDEMSFFDATISN